MSKYIEKLFDPIEFEIKNIHQLVSAQEKKSNPSILPKMANVRKVLLQIGHSLSVKKLRKREAL